MFQHCFRITCTIFLLLVSVWQPLLAQTGSQQGVITGQVLDDYGRPLQGAVITTKAGSAKVVTDEEGKFSIAAGPASTLVVKHPLFDVSEIKVKNDQELTIKLYDRYLHSLTGVDTGIIANPSQRKLELLYESKSPDKVIGSISTVYGN